MPKILQINSHYNKGGAGKIVSYLHKELLNNGYESVVIYGRDLVVNDKYVYKIGTNFSNKIDGIKTRLFGKPGFNSSRCTRKMIKIIEEEHPDLIHLQGLHGYYLNYKILFKYIKNKNIPCVWTFHDCLAFTAKCGYPYDCKKYLTGCYSCPRLKEYPKSLFLDRTKWLWNTKKQLFTGIDKMIIASPSNWMTNLAKESFFGEKYKCVTVNNGIDTNSTFLYRDYYECRKKHSLPFDKKIVLAVAFNQDDPRKGVKYVIETAQKLPDYYFVIIGCSDENFANLNNVRCLKFTNNQVELAEYYSAADVFLLPSLAENYATTAIESLSCGTPIVGFNVGGIPEQAYDIYGKTVEVGDSQSFIFAVKEVANKSFANIDLKLKISTFVRNRNSMENMFKKYIELYMELLK